MEIEVLNQTQENSDFEKDLEKEVSNDIEQQNTAEQDVSNTEKENASDNIDFENLFEQEQEHEQGDEVSEVNEEGLKVLGEGAFIVHKNILPFLIDKLLRLAGKKINYEIYDVITKEEKKTLVNSYNILIKHYLKSSPSPVTSAWSTIAAVLASQVLMSMEDLEMRKSEGDLFETPKEVKSSSSEDILKVKKRGRPRKNQT